MLRDLEEDATLFSQTLHRNLCIRMLQRRGVATRVARFVEDKEQQTDLDIWLDQVREEVMASGNVRLFRTFIETGDLAEEIRKFRDFERAMKEIDAESTATEIYETPGSNKVTDKFDEAKQRRKRRSQKHDYEGLSIRERMRMHLDDSPSLPASL